VTLTWPFWLVLALPLGVTLWLWRLPTRGLIVARSGVYVLILLAMAGLHLVLPSRAGLVVAVADRSLSMPPDAPALQTEAINLIRLHMDAGDKLAVVSFGLRPAIEMPPGRGAFAGFAADVGLEASNLADALETAVSLIPPDTPGRIVVLSDGLWTGVEPFAPAGQASAAGVAVDYRQMARSRAGDLAIAQLDAPNLAAPGEAFMITAWISSPLAQEVPYELVRGQTVIASGKHAVPAGSSRLMFRDKAPQADTCQYTLRVLGPAGDPLSENNTARLLVGVRGPKPILLVSPTDSTRLSGLLAAGGLAVRKARPEQCRWSLEELSGLSAVVLENIPANMVGTEGMETLAAWVTQTGGGLMMTGGRDSYGPGGYFKSPLEEILPVSMELRREHRKLSLAVVVALDRSGSMAIRVPDGRSKMDLADLATAEVLNMLSGFDQFGCIAVDSTPHVIVPLSDLSNKDTMRSHILRIDSLGGGIFIYEALSAAASMIAPATAGTRHIILFADAADSEEPGDYGNLLDRCRKAGVTVSVIGLGTERDQDAELLKDIARLGGGQVMFTDRAHDLPRLFAQDTIVVARSTFLDEPTAVRTTAGLAAITPERFAALPSIGGYNLCHLRPGANLAAVTTDENSAPVVAAWQAGCGRALACTAEADGKYTGQLARWPQVGVFFASLARWTAGDVQALAGDMVLTQEIITGACRIGLYLDPRRTDASLPKVPEVTVLKKAAGGKLATERMQMAWTSADLLEAAIPLAGSETIMASVDVGPSGRVTLPPVCLPYSPEYAPAAADAGPAALDKRARATGGIERVDLAGIWKDLPKKPRLTPLAPYLLLAAAVLLLGEVLQRCTGLLALRAGPIVAVGRSAVAAARRVAGLPRRMCAAPPPPAEVPAEQAPKPAEPAAPTPQAPGVLDALSRARSRARDRTKR